MRLAVHDGTLDDPSDERARPDLPVRESGPGRIDLRARTALPAGGVRR
jgi:hypothetical protein